MTVFEFCKALRRRIWSDSEILLLVRPAGKPLDDPHAMSRSTGRC